LALLNPYLIELQVFQDIKDGLRVISSSLVNLTSLSICCSPLVSSDDLDSLSKLSNLEKICFGRLNNLNDAVVHYSTLTKLKSIRMINCDSLSGSMLSIFVANKEFLVDLELDTCSGISSEGYHSLTTLTNLTKLVVIDSYLDNIGLNLICSSCLQLEDLIFCNIFIRINQIITIEGLNNMHYLTHLKSLYLIASSNDWLAKLSHNTALTSLHIRKGLHITYEGLSYLSNHIQLRKIKFWDCEKITNKSVVQGKFKFPIEIEIHRFM
jgi:hypothetical protein